MQWCNAAEIERFFIVTQDQLEAYAFRGNLSARRSPHGDWMYEVAHVARLFRRRKAEGVAGAAPSPTGQGKLGGMRLGDRWDKAGRPG